MSTVVGATAVVRPSFAPITTTILESEEPLDLVFDFVKDRFGFCASLPAVIGVVVVV